MGMYTEFHLNSKLIKDVPKEVINMLKFMLGDRSPDHSKIVHPLFETERWEFMLISDSHYIDCPASSTIHQSNNGNYYLSIRCNLRDNCSEIDKFLDWIKPYLDKNPGDFLGFKRHESTEIPTLLYYDFVYNFEVKTEAV